MPPAKIYATAEAFRTALEDRLKRTALTDRADLSRLRRQVAFDRLLARLFRGEFAPWILKGGYALELRLKTARSTVDIDLSVERMTAEPGDDTNRALQEMLQRAANNSLGDWFVFEIGSPIMDLTAAPYGGARYPVEARMDDRTFVRFHLDAGIGDVVIQPLEEIACRDWLEFAGIEPPHVRMISREQQFAEKIHAYTLPRISANSRVKDLVDLALLIRAGGLDRQRLLNALHLTFERRQTHEFPAPLPPPPAEWQNRFRSLAEECGLSSDLDTVFTGIQHFLAEVKT